MFSGSQLRSDGVPFAGGQFGEVLSFLRPTVQTIIECLPCRGQSRLSGFCCAHQLCVRSPCQHISRAHLITTAVRYQLRAQGRYFVPEPNMVGGVTGRSPGERPHDGIAGESPVPLGRTFPAKAGPRLNAGSVRLQMIHFALWVVPRNLTGVNLYQSFWIFFLLSLIINPHLEMCFENVFLVDEK